MHNFSYSVEEMLTRVLRIHFLISFLDSFLLRRVRRKFEGGQRYVLFFFKEIYFIDYFVVRRI